MPKASAGGGSAPLTGQVPGLAVDLAQLGGLHAALLSPPSELEARFRVLVDSNLVGIAWTDVRGGVKDANDEYLRITGFTREEVRAGTARWDRLSLPEYRELERLKGEEIRRNGSAVPFEKEYGRADGSRVPILIGLARIPGSETEVAAFVLDISDRKRAEAKLKESHDELAIILKGVAEAIMVQDPSGRIVFANDATAQLLGLKSPAELLQIPIESLSKLFQSTDEEGKPIPVANMPGRRALQGEENCELTFRFVLPETGQVRWTIMRANPVRDAQGKVTRAISILRDFTAMKRVEERLRFLLRSTAVLSGSLDYDAILTDIVNLSVPFLADWCRVDVLEGDRLRRVTTESKVAGPREFPLPDLSENRGAARSPCEEVLRTGQSLLLPELSGEMRAMLLERLGSPEALSGERRLSLLCAPLLNADRILGVITLISAGRESFDRHDLELADELGRRAALALEHARSYREARAAVRAREELLTIVSHDLRNPLNAVLANVALLPSGLKGETGNRLRKLGRNIENSVDRMSGLINDLLDLARLEQGLFTVSRETCALPVLVEEAVESIRALAEHRSLILAVDVSQARGDVLCDRARVLQVFSNLLGNAIKFTPVGGRILVKATREKAEIGFSVTDTGPGLTADELPRIFDRFWQGRREGHQGTGLGLSIAKGIVEAHGGRIWAENNVAGPGCSFQFTLPNS